MAKPPATVVRTLEPVGDLQLHRLDKRVRFHCVRCQRGKEDSLLAITNRNWTRTVCIACYIALIRAQRQAAKQRPEVKQKPPKVKKKPPEANKIRRQLPGLDSLLAFFRAADVRVEVVHGRCLRINGKQTQPLGHLPPPETLEWSRIVNEIALDYVGYKFSGAVRNNARFGDGLRISLRPREKGFAIMRDDMQLAVIHATGAQIPHREVIRANFLMPGPHWQQVADVVRDAEADLVAEWEHEQEAKAAAEIVPAAAGAERRPAVARRRIDHLPDDLAQELIDACLDASRRIRLERQVAYERPVLLECDIGELTLLPITATQAHLFVPFQFNKGAEFLKGELILDDGDPLPLLISEGVAYEDTITAWTCALLGFADATCIELESARPIARREPTRPRWRPSSSVSQRGPSAPTLPRGWPWPEHLEPVGRWIRYRGSFVAGHRRHLYDGLTASADARDRAGRVGIILRPHETWVRPHARGVPDGVEMRFLWHAPSELKLFRTWPKSR